MEIDDKLVQRLKAEHYEAVSIRSELEEDVKALQKEVAEKIKELEKYETVQEDYDELLEDIKEIYELLTSKRYAELFKKLSDVIYRTIGRVV